MRFVPRQPKEGINVSDTHPLVEAGTLIIGLAALFVAIAVALIFIVEIALYFVSAEDEARLFGNWLPDDLTTVSPADERLHQTQRLADRLAVHWPESPYEFRVEIDDSDAANAMALPGGLIVVTSGLLDQVESENELAFVLGHELGHFRNRDHLRALGRGALLSIFFLAVTSSDVGGVGIKAADLTLRSFNRRQEAAADAFGLEVVNREYGHVNDSWRLFERWSEQGPRLSQLASYVSTHPATADRVDAIRNLAADAGWRLDGDVTALGW